MIVTDFFQQGESDACTKELAEMFVGEFAEGL